MSDENSVSNNDFTSDTTREQLIRDYEGLVKKLAVVFSKYGMDTDDLVQEGNIGLMKAKERFNPALGVPFAAFARTWIRCFMRKALSKHSAIRIPRNTRCNLVRVRNARLSLKEKLGRKPTDLEIAEYLHISEKVVRGTKFADIRTLSIHNPLGEDGGDFQDVIPDDRPTPDRVLEDLDTFKRLQEAVEGLGARDRMIIQSRFGLDGGECLTLEQIGGIIGKTYQRAAQIEGQALNRLKSMMRDEMEAVR